MPASEMIDRMRAALHGDGPQSSDFDLNPQFRPNGMKLRPAAVLMTLVAQPGGWAVLLTKRASTLKHHPGQIAFPGGKVDPTDADPEAAALREAHEEVGLDPAQVTILGAMPPHETVTGFTVYPFVGVVNGPFTPVIEAGEVEEAFFVPLAHLLDERNYAIQSRAWLGQRRGYYTVPWGPYYIWGATARMLRAVAARLA
ncbi:CoA pyrophosphatase [Pararhodobacter zhoushanensis]|uniref:CoA pyrophosphatase n=1 Tax=Pararhodobacter zhoushanensis TaxID=2479545 RepID=A0ABT3GUJ6_9RHOB|nr:CoA pyrophosphatase [Pararhodobacter zhoushanensis]MCW1931210.1 CoA pyrophosphatase [Pararhodobacter zhoushanensis]